MDRLIFDSRNSQYKTPFGAVPCGRPITLTLFPPADCAGGGLVAHLEFAGQTLEYPLSPVSGDEGYTVTYPAPAEPELIWYCFRLERRDGSQVWLGKNGLCGEGQAACWQQTVYDDTLSTPEWFGKGVTYQIFPDRFHRTAIPDPTGMLGDRIVHQNWEELMEYLPDEHGEIRNRDFFGGSLMGIEEKLPYLWGFPPSTSAPFLSLTATTATTPATTTRSTPCWAPRRIFPGCVRRPMPWGSM